MANQSPKKRLPKRSTSFFDAYVIMTKETTDAHHKLIAKNTMALYLRMFVLMGFSIYTTRVVLETLGIIDYGIFNVVGGLIAMISSVTAALTISVQRFLNFEQGKGEEGDLSKVFSSAVIIHIIISLILLIVLETIGIYFLNTSINIPHEKRLQALIVFQLCSLSSCITLATTPFTSLIISFEKMNIFAYLSIVDVLLKLVIVYFLLLAKNCRLVLYAELTLGVTCIQALLNWLICKLKFVNVRFVLRFERNLFFKIFSFASWSAFGQLGWAFTAQGANILLNIFFGTVLNAAYGITLQMQSALIRFIQSFQTALNPQIVKKYANKDFHEVSSLIINGSKYSGMLLLIVEIPLFFEMKNVLSLWLTEVPKYTAIFCQLMLVTTFLDTLSNLLATAFQAYGKIRRYQLIVSAFLFLNFPLSYILLRFTNLPYTIYFIYSGISVLLLFTRLYLIKKYMKINLYKMFFCKVLWPLFKVLLLSCSLSLPILYFLEGLESIIQLITVGVSCILTTLIVEYYFGLKQAERIKLWNLIFNR